MNNYNILISIGLSAILAFIPANIAKRKGYSFGLWWLYGWLLFIVAIIHVNVIKDKNSSGKNAHRTVSVPYYRSKPINVKRYAVVSGISLILYVICLISSYFYQGLKYDSLSFPSIQAIFSWGLYIAIAVLIIMRKKNTVLVIVFGARVLLSAYWAFIPSFDLLDTVYLLVMLSMFALILFNSIPKLDSIAKSTGMCWFVPGVLMLVYVLMLWINHGFYTGSDLAYLYLLMDIFELIAFWAAGLWICAGNGDVKVDTKANTASVGTNSLSENHIDKTLEEKEKAERLKELEKKGLIIKEGDLTPEQLYQYANAFYQGTMVNAKDGTIKPDYKKALEYYERAGNQGHLPSQVNAAKMYLNGIGVEQDYEKAANWCVRAVAKGDKDANAETMYELGIAQLNGTNGFAKNEKFAFYFFKKSAEMGYVKAQVALGLLYSEGTGVEKDMAKAAEWFEKAADQGDNMACTNLGMMYLTGNGVQKDIGKAKSLLTRASMNDDTIAMINLGMLNITEGLEEQGLTWLSKAAEHPQGKQLLEAEALRGNKHAQKALDTLK